jgi:hypothetical protein
MPNAFAFLMLFSWPAVAWILFRTLPLSKALVWTMLGGYLILPSATSVKIPMLPLIDKGLVPTLSAAILCMIYDTRTARVAGPTPSAKGKALVIGLLALIILAPILSILNNPEPIVVGPHFLPGLQLYDAFSMMSASIVSVAPFLLAWRYLSTREAHRDLLVAFAVCGLAYSLPALFEVRMSPQLHTWIYGFFQHDFVQHIREGGFRPVVFLSHGLMVGILLCMSLLAALTLWRETLRERRAARQWIFAIDRLAGPLRSKWFFAAAWLAIVLLLSKNLGAVAIASFLGLVIFARPRLQNAIMVVIAVVVLFYPMLRGAGLIPVREIHEIARSISEERAQSLKFRLDNEDALLAHANEKPISGWGSWGRNQIYDPETGRMTSVTDGMWVILIGIYGWPGYVAHFGLLTMPLLLYVRRRRALGPSLITPGLVIVLSAALMDLLPNSGLVPYVWMLAGALTGFVLRQIAHAVSSDAEPAAAPHVRPYGWRADRPQWPAGSAFG